MSVKLELMGTFSYADYDFLRIDDLRMKYSLTSIDFVDHAYCSIRERLH